MRRLACTVTLFSLALLFPLSFTNGGEFKLEPGFTLIFNGKNLDGWQTKGKKESLAGKTDAYDGRMKVDGGSLHYVYTDKTKGDKYIETTKEYSKDVHLKFDFKPGPACNNDILFRGTKFDIVPGKGETKEVKEGEWYTFELIATGDKVEHKINGKVARAAKDAKAKASTIVLRAEFGVIEIKNIRVKE
jgi:3-keto-disaccharide hydrolase